MFTRLKSEVIVSCVVKARPFILAYISVTWPVYRRKVPYLLCSLEGRDDFGEKTSYLQPTQDMQELRYVLCVIWWWSFFLSRGSKLLWGTYVLLFTSVMCTAHGPANFLLKLLTVLIVEGSNELQKKSRRNYSFQLVENVKKCMCSMEGVHRWEEVCVQGRGYRRTRWQQGYIHI